MDIISHLPVGYVDGPADAVSCPDISAASGRGYLLLLGGIRRRLILLILSLYTGVGHDSAYLALHAQYPLILLTLLHELPVLGLTLSLLALRLLALQPLEPLLLGSPAPLLALSAPALRVLGAALLPSVM